MQFLGLENESHATFERYVDIAIKGKKANVSLDEDSFKCLKTSLIERSVTLENLTMN